MAFTTFTSGVNTSFSSELNANFSELINRKVYSSTTQTSVLGTSFADTHSFVLVTQGTGVLLGLEMEGDVWCNSPGNASIVGIKVTGSNLGTLYIQVDMGAPYINTTSPGGALLSTTLSTSTHKGCSAFLATSLLDTSTTVTIMQKSDNASTISYLKNINVSAIFSYKGTDR